MREPKNKDEKSLAGSLLLAHPSLQDKNFRRTVILMSSHNSEGAMGVVLNRPCGKMLGSLNAEFALSPLAQVPLFQGGPVGTEQVMICAWRMHPGANGFQLMVGINPEKAIEMQPDVGVQFRAYLGYAGWTAGQLEDELKQNAWVKAPLLPNLLDMNQDETLWRALLVSQDSTWTLFANEPEDPTIN